MDKVFDILESVFGEDGLQPPMKVIGGKGSYVILLKTEDYPRGSLPVGVRKVSCPSKGVIALHV